MAPWLTGPWLTGRCRTTPRHPRRQGPSRAVPLGHGLRHLERRQYRTYGPWNGSRSSVAMTLPLGRRWPEAALAGDSTGRRQHWPKTALAGDQRLEYWGAFRAFFSPAFLRSFTRASLVRKPARFRLGRFSGSTSVSARAIPSRSAPACPVTPPPVIRATTSKASSAPRVTNGSLISCWCTLFGKYSSSHRSLITHFPAPAPPRTRAIASLRRPVPTAFPATPALPPLPPPPAAADVSPVCVEYSDRCSDASSPAAASPAGSCPVVGSATMSASCFLLGYCARSYWALGYLAAVRPEPTCWATWVISNGTGCCARC